MPNSIERTLLWILRAGLALSLLYLIVYSDFYFFPFVTARTSYFQLIIALLFLPAAGLAIFFPQHRPRLTRLNSILAIYFLVSLIATLTAVEPSRSFAGTIERAFGFFNIMHYGMLFFIALVALNEEKYWYGLFSVSLALSTFAAIDLLKPIILLDLNSPTQTVTGNPTFLSANLLIHIFIAAHLFTKTKDSLLRFVIGAVVVIITAGLLASQVRGAFVGLVAAFGYLVILRAWKAREARMAYFGIMAITVILYGLLFVNRAHPFVKENPVLRRVTNFSLEETTIRSRLSMWRMALAGFKERPLLGWGRENFILVFNRYFDPIFDTLGLAEGFEDRTHNIFFDELVNGGIIGLLAYSAILITLCLMTYRIPLLFALLIGYTVQNLTGLDTINSFVPFFLYMAYVDFITQPKKIMPAYGAIKYAKPAMKSSAVFALALIITIGSITLNYRITKGNSAIQSLFRSGFDDYQSFDKAINDSKNYFKPFDILEAEAFMIVGNLIPSLTETLIQNKDISLPFIQRLANELRRLSSNYYHEYRINVALINILKTLGAMTQNIAYFKEIESIVTQLVALAPERKLFKETLETTRMIIKSLEAITSPAVRSPSRK